MRRFQALLLVAGLAAAPISAAAGPSGDKHPEYPTTFEWSMSRGRLGVMVMGLTPELRKYFGVAEDRGVLVARVERGSAAAAAGITAGDVLTDVRGKTVDDAGDVVAALADVPKGQTVAIKLVRDKKPITVDARLTDDAFPNLLDSRWPGADWLREMMRPFMKRERNTSS